MKSSILTIRQINILVIWAIIGSSNGLVLIWCQTITWTTADFFKFRPSGINYLTNSNQIKMSIQKIHLKMLPAKYWPVCSSGLNVLRPTMKGFAILLDVFSHKISSPSKKISSPDQQQVWLHQKPFPILLASQSGVILGNLGLLNPLVQYWHTRVNIAVHLSGTSRGQEELF